MTRTLDFAITAVANAVVVNAATTPAATATAAAASAAAAASTGAVDAGTPGDAPAAHRPCHEVCARVFEFLDGELPPALARAVRAHLAACGCCRRRVASDGALLAVIARAARTADGAAPLSLRARIHRALKCAETESGGERLEPPTPPLPAPRPSADRPRRPA